MGNFLGLDVGGTKTYCLISDEDGNVLGFGQGGTGSYEYHGVAHAARENRRAVDAALAEADLEVGDLTGVGLGVAGADVPEDFEMLEREIYAPLFGATPRVMENDSLAALRGGVRSDWGIVIVCGTGCVCAGRNREGLTARAGGLGPEFGDRCTGISIGQEGLRAVWRARDGITCPTSLTGRFVERAGCRDVDDLFSKVYGGEIGEGDLEPMTQVVFDEAVDGDPLACDILREGGRYLGAMVNAVAGKLAMEYTAFDLVTAGSVFRGVSPVFREDMVEVVHGFCSQARAVMPEFEPVVGALFMAMDKGYEVSDETYEAVSRGLSDILDRHQIQLKAVG